MKIELVDLKGQYDRIAQEIEQGIKDVMQTTHFIKGPYGKKLEHELAHFLGSKNVVNCANGTDALQIALMALDLKEGAEIITPAFTYAATVEVAKLLNFKPVYVDVQPDTFCVDPSKIEAAITDKTKAIIPVHLFGQSADMESIMNIALQHNLAVIEDNAQAIGADYTFSGGTVKKTGTIGTIGTTSFFPTKNLGCYGDGGALFCNDDLLTEKLRMIANHGQSSLYNFEMIGVNSRLDEMQAVVLLAKLKNLNDYTDRRQWAASKYDALLKNSQIVSIPFVATNTSHVYHQYTLKVKEGIDRATLKEFLNSKGIPTKVYYPIPMHTSKAYLDTQFPKGSMPVSEALSETVFSLPMHTELTIEVIEYVAACINQFENQ